jgi:thioredoxin-related protein
VIQAAGQVVPLKLDVDKKDVLPVAEKYGVSAIPAIFLMDATGKVVGKIEITTSPAQFASEIDRIVKASGPSKHIRAPSRKGKGN